MTYGGEGKNGEDSFFIKKESRYEVDMFFYSSHRDIQFFFFGQFPPLVCDVALSTHRQVDANLRRKELS